MDEKTIKLSQEFMNSDLWNECTHNSIIVWIALVSHADETGITYIGLKTLGMRVRLTEIDLLDALRDLSMGKAPYIKWIDGSGWKINGFQRHRLIRENEQQRKRRMNAERQKRFRDRKKATQES